jgi:DNA replication protein
MVGFSGFPDGKLRSTPIPSLFFSELLPYIEDVAELKVTLYAFWSLSQKEGSVRYMTKADFLGDELLMKSVGSGEKSAQEALETGIELAVARGTFLKVTVEIAGEAASNADDAIELLFLNTEKGRAAVDGIESGEWRPTPHEDEPITLMVNRPNIYVLYEQNIGTLTPMIADQLRDAEQTYPPEWVNEAVELAVQNNVRKWSYVSAILERWRQEGKRDGISRRDSQKELQGQIPEELRDIIER